MNDYTGTIAATGEHKVYLLHPAAPHPDAFGISTERPMAPAPDADAGPGLMNHHPGPDFAPPEPEAGS
jgi:hypothetical protein